jgi:hypothetical protein
MSNQCLLGFPPPEGDITALPCKKFLEKYCPPQEGVNFELITYSGFRGRMFALFYAQTDDIVLLLFYI